MYSNVIDETIKIRVQSKRNQLKLRTITIQNQL